MMQRYIRKPQIVEAIEFNEETEPYCMLICDGELEKDEQNGVFFLHIGEERYIRIGYGVLLVKESGRWYAETRDNFRGNYTYVY